VRAVEDADLLEAIEQLALNAIKATLLPDEERAAMVQEFQMRFER
jgi:hypothetical protein